VIVADLWERVLHEASYGGLRLDVLSTQDSAGRALARHVYPHRDGADLEDMGGEPRTTRCRVIFLARGADDNPLERFARFEALVRQGQAHTFVHPLTGSYEARVSQLDFVAEAEPRDVVLVDCTFEEDTTEPAAFEVGAVDPPAASAAQVDLALGQVGQASPVSGASVAAAERWSEGSTSSRDIGLELVALSDAITAETDRLECATRIDRHGVFVALSRLHYSLRRAAHAAQSVAPRLFEITVQTATPLLVIAARTYGAAQASAQYDELLRLNDLPNPARVEAGTVLRARAVEPARAASRGAR
jgi:prophage DNA circulation protein